MAAKVHRKSHPALTRHVAVSDATRAEDKIMGNKDAGKLGDGDRNENRVAEQDRARHVQRDEKKKEGDKEIEKQSNRDTGTR